MRLFDPVIGAKIPQSGTFNANPLTLVAGLATLRLLTPDVYERMAGMAQRLATELVSTLRDAGIPAAGTAVGSIFRVYLSEDAPQTYRETARDNKMLQRWLTMWLLNHDTQWQQGGYISMVTEDHHLDRLIELVKEAMRDL